jgi:hypothetical protein
MLSGFSSSFLCVGSATQEVAGSNCFTIAAPGILLNSPAVLNNDCCYLMQNIEIKILKMVIPRLPGHGHRSMNRLWFPVATGWFSGWKFGRRKLMPRSSSNFDFVLDYAILRP